MVSSTYVWPRLARASRGLHVAMSGEPRSEEVEQLLAGLEAALFPGSHPLDLTRHRLRLAVPLGETDHEIVEAIGMVDAGRGLVHGVAAPFPGERGRQSRSPTAGTRQAGRQDPVTAPVSPSTLALLRTLGEVCLEGGSAVLASRRKELTLLAYLARRMPRPVTRAELASLLWEDRVDAKARQSLRQALLDLK